jgi:hypothetical protein
MKQFTALFSIQLCYLINFIVPRKEGVQGSDLEEDTTSPPEVHFWTVEAVWGV